MDEPGFAPLAECRVKIVGLGLMGGSLALALRGRCREITGADVDPSATSHARAHGLIDRLAAPDAPADCDLLVLATPVRAILARLQALAQAPSPEGRPTCVMDLGSTKAQVAAAMQALPAAYDPVGGHPMCGKETSGIAHAQADLFRGHTFVLTPLARTTPAALDLAHELVEAIGAVPVRLTAERHDALAAVTSHLPYAAAAALTHTAAESTDPLLSALLASGFRDTSRLAASDAAVMTDIFLTNRRAILDALGRFRRQLDGLAHLIEEADPTAIGEALAAAQRRRIAWYPPAAGAHPRADPAQTADP